MIEKEGQPEETFASGKELEKRKEEVIGLLKRKKEWIYFLILAAIVWIGVHIRTLNISKLKDVTTGTWTLGPDLDPFLFLRWATYIVENGRLMITDVMRYVPLGFNTAGEMKLLAYLIAGFYRILSVFSQEVTVTYAAIWFPVVMFGLTAVAFFLFAKKVFYQESKIIRNIIALTATAIFVVVPSLLPRTIAGIPEKESAAFFFMFLAFYFFLEAFTSEKLKREMIFGILSGISTGLLALIWGGMIFVFFTIPPTVLLAFAFGKIDRNKFLGYSSWMFASFAVMMPFSTRYSINNLIHSTSTGLTLGVFAIVGISLIFLKLNKFKEIERKIRIPKEALAMIISGLIILVIVLLAFGPSLIFSQISNIKTDLIQPMITRFGLTVAESRQPYFADEWKGSFGPVYFNIPLFFWLFVAGSVALFNQLVKKMGAKNRFVLTLSYFVFILCLIFSRYSSGSVLNGTSILSLIVYFGGVLLFLYLFARVYVKKYREGDFYLFRELNFAYILYFITLTLGIIGARGGIRLIMVLAAVSPIAISFLVVKVSHRYLHEKEDTKKFFVGVAALILIISSAVIFWNYYQQDKSVAENFAPGFYQIQWQKAMSWVRDYTPINSVFTHWWDYGYWLQSIGNRSTILDGGNAIVYWNYLMGRYVLTGTDENQALEFLYTHNATHLLIDSTDIGKYTAFSSIGSDENYDRFSWIGTFLMNDAQTQETSNGEAYIYLGGTGTDEDIVWKNNGTDIFLPGKKSAIGAILLEKNKLGEILQPKGIFVYNNNQYPIPLRYVYSDGKLHDFGSGLDAGVFLFPRIDSSSSGISVNDIGAALYLSKRTVHSQLANLYLFGKETQYFTLAHLEKNPVVEGLEQQGKKVGEFVYYQGLQGPIKIWKISYPSGIQANPEFLKKSYPNEDLNLAKLGEYGQ